MTEQEQSQELAERLPIKMLLILMISCAFLFGVHCGIQGYITREDMEWSAPWIIMALVAFLATIGAVT